MCTRQVCTISVYIFVLVRRIQSAHDSLGCFCFCSAGYEVDIAEHQSSGYILHRSSGCFFTVDWSL